MSYHVYQSMLCFLGMINLDFFRVVYKPFCVHPSLTLLHALAMDYIIAVYPLIIVIVTYFLVSLYIRKCWFLSSIWKPLRDILRPILRNMDLQTSLIDSFATLFLLSTAKFQSVSFDILLPTLLYSVNGTHHKRSMYPYISGGRSGIFWTRALAICSPSNYCYDPICDSACTSSLPIPMSMLPENAKPASLQFSCSESVHGCVSGFIQRWNK